MWLLSFHCKALDQAYFQDGESASIDQFIEENYFATAPSTPVEFFEDTVQSQTQLATVYAVRIQGL